LASRSPSIETGYRPDGGSTYVVMAVPTRASVKRIRQVSASINAAIASERADQVDPDQPEEGGLPRVTELDGLLADDLRRELQDETDEQGGDREGEKTT
jgi:hypothetical protein